jgi:hypothetical protein
MTSKGFLSFAVFFAVVLFAWYVYLQFVGTGCVSQVRRSGRSTSGSMHGRHKPSDPDFTGVGKRQTSSAL